MQKLDKILYPHSVALIGASEKEGSVGNELLKRMLEFRYEGQIFPINPKYEKLSGIKCFAKITDVPNPIDLAIIAVPSKFVSGVIDECHLAQVHDVIVISSGFKEIGQEGAILEKELKAKIDKYKMHLVGPNCLGVFNADKNLTFDGCFAPTVPKTGSVGFATQSGALATGVFNISSTLRIGFSQMVSLGNQADVDALDVLEQWENDKNVSQILLYLESIKEPIKFRKIATRVSAKKPILAIKSGRSAQGAKAAASHTGSLAGQDSASDGLLKSCGIVREKGLREMFNSAQVLGKCPLPSGKRVGILTNAGGPGILATDVASDFDLQVPTFSENLQQKLKTLTLPQASVKNPIDLVASASVENYDDVASELLKSDEIDMLLVIYLYITGKNDLQILSNLEKLRKKYPTKPIITVYMTTPDFENRVKENLPDSEIPIFDYVDDAVRGLKLLADRREFLNEIKQKTPVFDIKTDKTQKIFAKAEKEVRTLLTTKESLEILGEYGLSLPKFSFSLKLEDALKKAKKIGFPVVIKASSKKVSHKTDVGGVFVNIKDEKEFVLAWKTLEERFKEADLWDSLDSVIIMKHIKSGGREFVSGIIRNEEFGHQMMFGIGGIFVESLKEVCFRPCPLTIRDANALVQGTKAKNLMGNVRGKKAVDQEKVIEMLLRLSRLVEDFPKISELDINPFMLDEEGNMFAVDARIVVK